MAGRDYEVIDTSSGEKLERWGIYSGETGPQVIWDTPHGGLTPVEAENAHYHRSSKEETSGNLLIFHSSGRSLTEV